MTGQTTPTSPWDNATPINGHLYRRLPTTDLILWECWTCRAATASPSEHADWHTNHIHRPPRKLPMPWRWVREPDPVTGSITATMTKETA